MISIKIIPGYEGQLGRKFVLNADKILIFIEAIEELKEIIEKRFEK